MKIKNKKLAFSKVLKITPPKHKKPQKPWWILGALIRIISLPDLWSAKFKFTSSRMDKAGKGPYFILMNHSSFIDLQIVYKIFFPKPFNIIATSDSFVGKSFLMRKLGCIPTNKFVTDVTLISDILHTVRKNKCSVVMYPEASYSFDGCATPLPQKLGVLIKKLGIPVVTVMTDGAFLRDPLYNGLQKRKVKVKAEVNCLFTKEEIAEKSANELTKALENCFTFDNFARQYETKTPVTENFRADGLERILYRCANCGCEEKMVGKGTKLQCGNCGKTYEMDIYGRLNALEGETEFPHIPDWYKWERECVKKEIADGSYLLDTEVTIGVLADYKAIYMVGEGRLIHTTDGFTLIGCDGKLNYQQSASASYGLYADYYWYEIDDVICIGDRKRLYYCFPKQKTNVAKARLAAEEIYNLIKNKSLTIKEAE